MLGELSGRCPEIEPLAPPANGDQWALEIVRVEPPRFDLQRLALAALGLGRGRGQPCKPKA